MEALFAKQKAQGGKTVPTLKVGQLSVSIRQNPKDTTPTAQQQSVGQETATVQPVEEDFIFNENDIRYYWLEFANQLPIEENATAGRMKNLRPKLLTDTTFEVAVENELVSKKMQSMAPHIVKHMRTKLHNSKIEMTVRIIQSSEAKRAYGTVEQFKMMSKTNPVLLKFKEAFKLELN